MAVATTLAPLPTTLGAGPVTSIVLVAVAGAGLAAIGLGASRRTWAAVVGLIVMVLPPFVAVALVDTPLVGPIVDTAIAAAPQHRWASGYRFTDGALRVDLARGETIVTRGRGSKVFRTAVAVAPVVPADWTPAQSVTVWAVAEDTRAPPDSWRQPLRAGIRLLPDEDRDAAVQRIERSLRVTSSADRVLIRWVADPSEARLSAWMTLLQIIAVGGACWTGLVLVFGGASPRDPRSRR